MAPKSGEVDTVEGGNTEPETTNSTELATEPVTREVKILAYQIARCLALDLKQKEEEEEEEDEEEDEDEEKEEKEEENSCESDQEWDVDSFEGVEFHSDAEPDDEEWRRYVRQCYKSEGFNLELDYLPTRSGRIYTGFYPVKLDEYFGPPSLTGRMYMDRMVKVVIEKYNKTKGKNLVLDHIVRTVVKMAVGVKAYITFMARESPEGELVEYQGKAEWKVWQRNIHPLLCRPTSEQRKRD